MSNLSRLRAAVLTLLLVGSGVATAQQDVGTAAPLGEKSAKPQAAVTVEQSRPSVYYLPDKQGNLQPVLDFQYQDFLELYKLKNQLRRRDEPPRYSLQRMSVSGVAGKENVELKVRLQVSVCDDDWVRIPLRLEQGVLRGAVEYVGSGKQLINYESNGEGYVCWIRGKADSQHEVVLSLLVPLVAKGDQPRLKLCTPRAAASELKLKVPMADAVGMASEDVTVLTSTSAGDNATELNVVGFGGELELTWRKADPRVAESPPALEATGTVTAKLDGHSIASEAALSVRSYGDAFERFVVRLPPGFDLLPQTVEGYVVAPLKQAANDKDDNKDNPAGLAEVRMAKKTIGPVEIRLACRRDYDPLKDQTWCELAGFEVLGAIRQWGTLAVAVPDDWQVAWGDRSDLREIEPLSNAADKEDLVADFEYSVQPYSLTARLAPRKTHVRVDPKYLMLIDPDMVRLEGMLSYTIRGAKTTKLEIAIPGWKLDEVGPNHLISTDGATGVDGNCTISLAKPASGTIELRLRAHRAVNAQIGSFRIDLPRPQADSVAPAMLTVAPADNVELIPNGEETQGLARQWITPPQAIEIIPERRQEMLYYRGTDGEAVFAAGFRVHPRQISVDVTTRVGLGERVVDVEQRQSYTIIYEPIDRLTVAVPRVLARSKRLEVFCDGKPMMLTAVSDAPVGNDPAAQVTMRVILPGPRIGSCELTLRYAMPLIEPTPQKPSSLSVLLPTPDVGQCTANNLIVKAAGNIKTSYDEPDEWKIVENDAANSGSENELRLSADRLPAQLKLNLRWKDDADGTTVVNRAWIQSWLSSSMRQDRAAYQVITDRKELEVIFPAGTALDQVVALVGGKQVNGRSVGKDRLLIPLPGPREQRRVVIELLYHDVNSRPPRGALCLEFPRLGPNAWVRRMFWQLVLPADEHVVANPAGFTGEFAWGWRDFFWGRQPLLDQEQLETWIGVAPRAPPPERANLYLYSALGNPRQAELRTAGRPLIVLLASGAALIVGLLLIYVPVSRHPATLLTLGIALFATGLIAPEPTLLLAQAAGLGLVLTLLAGLLERGMTRRRRRAAIRKEPSSARVELGSTHSRIQTPSAFGQASTETLPAIQSSSPGNAEP